MRGYMMHQQAAKRGLPVNDHESYAHTAALGTPALHADSRFGSLP
jgi:hypothetical protein